MKKLFITFFFFHFIGLIAFARVKEAFDETKSEIYQKSLEAKSRVEDTAQEVAFKVDQVKDVIDEKITKTKKAFSDVLMVTRKMFTKSSNPTFCSVDGDRQYAPTIDDARIIEEDTERMIPVIKKYSPILYLFNETYYPVAAEDYFLDPNTSLVYKESNEAAPEVVIPAGEITMEKIYENRLKYKGNGYYFDIQGNTKYGSDPKRFTDKDGNLTTPIYVNWSKQGDKIYIVYAFVYAYNGAYPIAAPIVDVRLAQDGAHEFDIEHIVVELDATTQEAERIYFATHTRKEGVWLAVDHKDISYEGTHPVVYVARNGHGSYPRAGTHVRIFGFGNDITSRDYKSHRWVPQMVLVYPETDTRFDPKTLGWVYHSGAYGMHGVDSFKRFVGGNGKYATGEDKGMPHEKVQFCKNPVDPSDDSQWAKYRFCVGKKRVKATIP
jgi:hypothetical protein